MAKMNDSVEGKNEEIYKDPSVPLEARVDDLIGRMTFREKCMLCAGEGENSPPAIPRLGIPRFGMTDGPHGVSPYKTGVGPGGISLPNSAVGTSTYFPTGIQLASTCNPALLEKFGKALAEETRAVGRMMQLGPSMNICRNPMNGRTFEYFSEDPFLSGKCGAAVVRGMQSVRVAPCVKHYLANNFESNRFKVNAIISQRALREIYMEGFRIVVEEADPWGIMSAYNQVNGVFVSESSHLIRDVLKDEWSFSGVVVSDWGATKRTSGIIPLIKAGLDIEMGRRNMYDIDEMQRLRDAGRLPMDFFNDNTKRILRTMIRVGGLDDPEKMPKGSINTKEHQAIARQLAEEGMVLLKNERNILPLDIDRIKKIAIVGKHADLKFGRSKLGGGSSAVLPPYEITIREGVKARCRGKIEIVDDPASADVAIACVGLEHTHDFKGGDHEGSDRLRYGLGFKQNRVVQQCVDQNPNTIVVCVNGQPFSVEKFQARVPAILEAWYGGMEIGSAVAAILFGDVNPSGKLPVSWPREKRDIPTALSFLKTVFGPKQVTYDEGVFIGYRYFDTKGERDGRQVRFCFGHGLSYTNFSYGPISMSTREILDDEICKISCPIKNDGVTSGAEIVQLYVEPINPPVNRPVKELKGFQKIFLSPSEDNMVTFSLDKRSFSYFDEKRGSWVAADGEYKVLLGSSSGDIRKTCGVTYRNG